MKENTLCIGYLCSTYDDRWFDTAAATLWNNLPNSLRNIQSVDSFKKDLKTHLFRQAYGDYYFFLKESDKNLKEIINSSPKSNIIP
jgi:hypothetical protein